MNMNYDPLRPKSSLDFISKAWCCNKVQGISFSLLNHQSKMPMGTESWLFYSLSLSGDQRHPITSLMQQLKIEMWRYYLAELSSILLYAVTWHCVLRGLPQKKNQFFNKLWFWTLRQSNNHLCKHLFFPFWEQRTISR